MAGSPGPRGPLALPPNPSSVCVCVLESMRIADGLIARFHFSDSCSVWQVTRRTKTLVTLNSKSLLVRDELKSESATRVSLVPAPASISSHSPNPPVVYYSRAGGLPDFGNFYMFGLRTIRVEILTQ